MTLIDSRVAGWNVDVRSGSTAFGVNAVYLDTHCVICSLMQLKDKVPAKVSITI